MHDHDARAALQTAIEDAITAYTRRARAFYDADTTAPRKSDEDVTLYAARNVAYDALTAIAGTTGTRAETRVNVIRPRE